MEPPTASTGNVRQCLQSLFRNVNVGRQGAWGVALRDMVAAFMTSDASAQRTLFDEVLRLASQSSSVDTFIEALTVVLDFDFGDEQVYLKVLQDLADSLLRCSRPEQVDKVVSVVRRVTTMHEGIYSEFVLQEAPKRWDQVRRPDKEKDLELYAACTLLTLFAGGARNQISVAIHLGYAAMATVLPPLLSHANENISTAALKLLRVLLKLTSVDDDALEDRDGAGEPDDGKAVLLCETYVSASAEPPAWVATRLLDGEPQPEQLTNSLLHCLIGGLAEKPACGASIMEYARSVDGPAFTGEVSKALEAFGKAQLEDAADVLKLCLQAISKPDLPAAHVPSLSKTVKELAQVVDGPTIGPDVSPLLTNALAGITKKALPGLPTIIDTLAWLSPGAIDAHVDKVTAWIRTMLSPKTPARVRNAPLATRVLAAIALSGCTAQAFAIAPDVIATLSESDATEVRVDCVAVLITLCVTHVSRDVELNRVNNSVLAIINQLLDVAVADPDVDVRTAVLSELESHPALDGHLVLSDPLECLFMAVNDSASSVAVRATTLCCRVALRNPSIIGPGLSRIESRLVRDAQGRVLSLATDAIEKLRVMAQYDRLSTPQLTLETLCVEKLSTRSSSLTLQCSAFGFLETIVERAKLTDRHMEADVLVKRSLQAIRNPLCSPRRRAAADTLAAVLRYVSTKVDLMEVFRQVVDVMLGCLRHDPDLVNGLSQVVGAIGAVHQARALLFEGAGSTAAVSGGHSERFELESLKPPLRSNPRLQFQNASVALYTLAKCLKGDQHQQRGLIQCMGELIDVIGPQQRQQLVPHLVPCLLQWLTDRSRGHLHAHILTQLKSLWDQRDAFTKPLRLSMLQTLEVYSRQLDRAARAVAENFVALLVQIAKGAPEEVRGQLWIASLAQQRLVENRDNRVALLSVELLEAIVFALDKDLHHILSQILFCAGSTSADVQLRCLSFLGTVVHLQVVKDCCARIVHGVLDVTKTTAHKHVQTRAVEFLCTLISTVGNSANRFVKVVEATLSRAGVENETFTRAMAVYTQTGSFPPQEERRETASAAASASSSESAFVVTSRADLSNQQVKIILAEALTIPPMTVNVISNVFTGGQTVIKFRFENVASETTQSFINLVNHEDTALRRLEIASMNTERVSAEPSQRDFGRALAKLRSWRRMQRSSSLQVHEWSAWLTSVTLELVHCSEPALRTLSEVVKSNVMLAREIFPFTFVWVFSKLDAERKRDAMATLSGALERSTPEVRQILFGLAEFMESERSEQVITRPFTDAKKCVVKRASLEEKFGIHYEGEGSNIVVVKVAEGGPGHRAQVPVGYTLKKIDGVDITAVSQIVAQIKAKTETTLDLVKEDQRRHVSSRHRPFFDLEKLATVAYNSHLFAKALHFFEMLFEEAAMSINEAEMRESSKQIIQRAATALTNIYNVTGYTHEYAGLQKMTEVLLGNEASGVPLSAKSMKTEDMAAATVRQLEAQGRFEEIVAGFCVAHETDHLRLMPNTNDLCISAANAAMALGQWDTVARASSLIRTGPERSFFEAAASVARNEPFDVTKGYLVACRREMGTKFGSEISESYSTAYDSLLQLQHLSHLKEVCIYRAASDSAKQRLHDLWSRRLTSMSRNAQHWTTALAINSIVVRAEDDLDARLTYASICREVGWRPRAERVLGQLLGVDSVKAAQDSKLYTESTKPRVALALFKERYHSKQHASAISDFDDYMTRANGGQYESDPAWGRCHLTLGEWLMNAGSPDNALSHVRRATEVDPSNIGAWHAWGMLAYRQAEQLLSADSQAAHSLIVQSIDGLSRAVELGEERLGTQDTLRILSIWFAYGHKPQTLRAVLAGIQRCPITAWLRVVPQLIARLGTCHRSIRATVEGLVREIAAHFPHALIYPLTVTEKSGRDAQRRLAASDILKGIREAQPALVDQASLISNELVRIAILWAEKWTDTLTRTSRMPERQECKTVLENLQNLYEELEVPTTGDEKLFESHYGQTLRRAKSALGNEPTAANAWNFFQQVYQKISRPSRHLQLHSVSPKLAELKNSVVPVPGLGTQSTTVTIAQFQNDIHVIPSKHKPRRFALKGSDGIEYRFLLKGHEDLRQDERVMQLFDLLNTVFRTDPSCNSLGLRVVRYTAVPLSDNVGILSWIDNSDTLFKLIEARRSATGVPMHEECNLIVKRGRLNKIEEFQGLPKSTRKDLLQFAIDSTPSDEMRRIMWDANDTCESWLGYRATYGRTLAVMSMVGYLLGLGDRHLNNLMILKEGAIVHIDFGDCFEVAMNREQFPERVPFRLTRLLVRALGVMEVEGTFRLTCELVVKQLRKFRDSLLSVLETFVDDPLVSWRSRKKVGAQQQQQQQRPQHQGTTHSDPSSLDSGVWSTFAAKVHERVGDATKPIDVSALEPDSSCAPLLQQPHDVALARARKAVMHQMETKGVDSAVAAFVSYLPVLGSDLRICGDEALAPIDQIEQFFANSHEAPHREFGDRALNRIKSKLSGTDFTSADATAAPSPDSRSLTGASQQSAFSVNPDFFIRDSVFAESVDNDANNEDDGSQGDRVVGDGLSSVAQVQRLIAEARSMENLADAYLTGWAPFL